ncbi:c-type cytochrome biogenesis protein CcsB [Gordonia sp. HY285]|uniref:c-type cytochrome biogenesis protein CcsB n=1 Tax=Gordonia liuliyuniae TaxID=2911517 RepID=UPI001F002345|nr:c-type cytochrome biogenesis protein CcsB [Gordonia liuliyuniae]MCF8611986.1 c-type cytochrome biogenesis protein CcsB [Gordonia liuliyuniae]
MEETSYVNETLGQYSDWFYATAVTVYAIAMILFLASLASARFAKIEKTQARELVGAGASVSADDRVPGRVAGPAPRRGAGERLGSMAYPVVWVGLAAHLTSIVLRGVATDRAPWGNMYEFISLTCIACVAAGVVVLRRREHRPLLSFVLIPVILLMFIAGKFLYTVPAPVVPALKSYWLAIHVSIISISSGVLLVSGVASILFLVKQRWNVKADETASGFSGGLGRLLGHLPSLESLDRLAYKCVVIGFPLFGLGVICGAIWAESAWGRFWGWDPKETVSFIAWVIYAAYLHARATAGWRNAAAWINVAGFVALLFNLFAINLVVSGLHSYAGL